MNSIQFSLKDNTYKIEIVKIAQEHCRPNKSHEVRIRDYFSLHFVLNGFGNLIVGDEKYLIGKNMAFLLYGGKQYEYYPDENNPWTYIWIDFYAEKVAGDDPSSLFEMCGFKPSRPFVRFNDAMQILVLSLLENYDSGALQSLNCTGYFLQMLGNLVTEKNKYAPATVRGSLMFRQFRGILFYINNNYRMNLTIEQIAEDMYVSEKQLVTMFRNYMQMTPINYVNKFRVANACVILKDRDVSVEAVSKMVGIDDVKYFTRLFTKFKGVSPREYRKNCETDDPFDWLKALDMDYR